MDVASIDLASVDHVLSTTRAVRKRLDLERPVEREILERCIEIATQAPTGLYGETWHFVVVTQPDKRAAIAALCKKTAYGIFSGALSFDPYLARLHAVSADDPRKDFVIARLDWLASDLLAIFPFRHCVELVARLRLNALTLETTLTAGSDGAVPVSFGFHPYLRLPDLSRKSWQLQLPEMPKLVLDEHGIPTGEEVPFGGFNASLGDREAVQQSMNRLLSTLESSNFISNGASRKPLA